MEEEYAKILEVRKTGVNTITNLFWTSIYIFGENIAWLTNEAFCEQKVAIYFVSRASFVHKELKS